MEKMSIATNNTIFIEKNKKCINFENNLKTMEKVCPKIRENLKNKQI